MNAHSLGIRLGLVVALVAGMSIGSLKSELTEMNQAKWIVQSDSVRSARHWIALVGGETVADSDMQDSVAAWLSESEADVLRNIPGVNLHADQQILTAANTSSRAFDASL